MSDVRVQRRDRVLVVTIERPEVRNAVRHQTALAIAAAWDELDADDGLVVGVITGVGSTFCAGRDLKAGLTGDHPWVEGRGFAGMVERTSAKPVIAAVEGHALGGGFEIALACDLIVAGDTALFGLPEVSRGRIAGAGGLNRLAQRIPYHLAVEVGLTGDHYPAVRMAEMGLVNRVVPAGTALDAALALAERIGRNGPLAVRASLQVLRAARDWPSDDAFALLEPIAAAVRASEDAREGARAFAEKRPPQWLGR